MNNILMYCHNGSGNHGCEAIIRSTVQILRRTGPWQYYQISRNPDEDRKYGLDTLVQLLPEFSPVDHRGSAFWKAYLSQRMLRRSEPMDILSSQVSFCVPQGPTVSLSIGGDNYCYNGYQLYSRYHRQSQECGHKTVLWGCSVEPDFLEKEDLLADLKTFDKILVRESISLAAMCAKGLENVVLYPDPAFTLEPCWSPQILPPENTVGINVSPMVMGYGSEKSDILGNYEELIHYLLQNTDMNIALVPHVVWDYNDDRLVLQKLWERFPDEPRITLVSDMDCTQLKAYISKLRFFVGARTHATIAAYSSGVPTLVAGYSVKSRGIARDIFGTEENYVVSVRNMQDSQELTNAFRWIMDNEASIRQHLNAFMPQYIEQAYRAGQEIMELLPQAEMLKPGIPADSCVGCGACISTCPVGCLQMAADAQGFTYPAIAHADCIDCYKCQKVCPVQFPFTKQLPLECVGVKHREEKIRSESSSGGVFTALASNILKRNGVVYGAAWGEDWSVHHIRVTCQDNISRLRGAKYAQSRIAETYQWARADLEKGASVLFSGTPCQIAGLKSFLGKNYERLVCVDIICHGVPSPEVWRKYLHEVCPDGAPKLVNLRSKESGWSNYQYSLRVEHADGSCTIRKNGEDLFLRGMTKDLILRPSCSDCRFKGASHQGDITLGDFWGIWNLDSDFDDNRGVSAVVINSEKGQKLIRECNESLLLKQVTLADIRKENPSWEVSSHMHKNREVFFEGVSRNVNIHQLIEKCTAPDITQRGLIDYLSAIKQQLLGR